MLSQLKMEAHMRKALIIATIFTLALTGKLFAWDSISAKSGSVEYGTVSFTSSRVVIWDKDCTFEGLFIDSATITTPPATVTIVDTGTTVDAGGGNSDAWRISVTTVAAIGAMGFFTINPAGGIYNFVYKPPVPVRMKHGLSVVVSNATIKKVIVLFRKLKE